jgi:uncharacterized membrane protein YedE/YeeE
MVRIRSVLAAGAILGGGLVLAPAFASEREQPVPQQTFSTAEDCMQSGDAFKQPTCSRVGNGPWIGTYGEQSRARGGFVAVLVIAVLFFCVLPTFLSYSIASSRNQNVGTALALGLFLGWVGVFVQAYVLKPEATAGTTLPRPPVADPAQRLAQLEELKTKGLITPEEYASRREAILGQL